MKLVGIQKVQPIRNFVVHLWFTDESERDVDLEKYMRGSVFDEIRSNPAVFQSVRVDPLSRTICWDKGADIDPDTINHNLTPAWADKAEHELVI